MINLASTFGGERGRTFVPSIAEFTKVLNKKRLAAYWDANASSVRALNLTDRQKKVVTGNYIASYSEDLADVYRALDELVAAGDGEGA